MCQNPKGAHSGPPTHASRSHGRVHSRFAWAASSSSSVAGGALIFAWIFNLDADFQLTRRGYCTPKLLQAQLDRNGVAARALMGPNDVLVGEGTGVGRAWCPTPQALSAMRQAGITPEPHPTVDVLRRVNHRLFACELGGGLPDQHYVTTRDQLGPLLGTRRLLKRPLAFAGRGQLRVEGPLDAKQQAWIDASLAQDGLVVEPLVSPSLEVSMHGFLWRDGHYELGHLCRQEVTARGVFLGIARHDDEQLTRTMRETLERVANALHTAGYFGPFGVDAYRYERGFCALSEINARYSMGFAVGFPRPCWTLQLAE